MATWGYYGTLTEHNNYWASHGNPATWTGATDAAKTAALVTATEYLDASYRWKGIRATETQALDWPRTGALDSDYYAIANTVVPQVVKDCVSILANEVLGGATLLPDVAAGEVGSGAITEKSETIGPISESTSYSGSGASISHVPQWTKVSRLLRRSGLIETGGRAVRG